MVLSFSPPPAPDTPRLPINDPSLKIGTPPPNKSNSGKVFKFLQSGLYSAFFINSKLEVLVESYVYALR